MRRRIHRRGNPSQISFQFTGTTHIHTAITMMEAESFSLPPADGFFVMPTHEAGPQYLRTSVGAGRGSSRAGYPQQTQNAGHTYVNLSDVFWEAICTGQVVSLCQGLRTKNLQSFISQFVYFYGYSYFKRLYTEKSGSKSIGTSANLIIAAAAGACTAIVTQPLDTASLRMQTSAFGKSKGLWKTLTEGTWGDAFDGLGISLLLISNPSIQYTVFDQLKRRLLKEKQDEACKGASPSPMALSAFTAFVLGAVSKSIATFLTYPAIRSKR